MNKDKDKCYACGDMWMSNSRNPKVPPGGTVNDLFFECPSCGQRWYQMNTFYHLWQTVKDEAEWNNLRQAALHPMLYDDY